MNDDNIPRPSNIGLGALHQFRVARDADAERGADFRARAKSHLDPLLDLLREADRDGFTIEFAFARDNRGIQYLSTFNVLKRY